MNLRVFKKDILFLTEEFVSDGLLCLSFAIDDKRKEDISAVLKQAVDLQHDTIAKINHPDSENLKAYYKDLTEEFLNALDALYDKLSEATRKEEAKAEPKAAKKPAAKKPAAKKEA